MPLSFSAGEDSVVGELSAAVVLGAAAGRLRAAGRGSVALGAGLFAVAGFAAVVLVVVLGAAGFAAVDLVVVALAAAGLEGVVGLAAGSFAAAGFSFGAATSSVATFSFGFTPEAAFSCLADLSSLGDLSSLSAFCFLVNVLTYWFINFSKIF